MKEEEKQKLEELVQRIQELETWKEQKTTQQISNPLDESSKRIIESL